MPGSADKTLAMKHKNIVTLLILYMKKLFDSDWLRTLSEKKLIKQAF